MKVLFMGTPDFALFSLKELSASHHSIVGVVTQPDKPRGRGYTLTPPPVKVFALENGYKVYQPATLKDGAFSELLEELSPDVIAVVAYGKILPKSVLDFPRYGCINVHGSLLPQYRGAAPMQRAIIDGRRETGVTTMYMEEGLDTGDMLFKDTVAIESNDNFEDVHDKLGICGARLLLKTLEALENGSAVRIPQDSEAATYAAKITKDVCAVDFSADAETVHNLIRGLSPAPLAFTHTPDGKLLKIISAEPEDLTGKHGVCGEITALDGKITVACGKGSISLLKVLPEGKSRMNAADFIRGRKLNVGDILK